MDDMSKTSLQIVYDGPALQSHEMEVRDLAPALLALGDLFEEANATLNDGRTKVSISVKGSFKTGCFAIDLGVTQSLIQQAQDLFAGNPVTAALNLVTILGLTGTTTKGVFQLIKWVRNRKITNVEIMSDGVVRIFCDEDHFETEERVLALFRNWKLRKAFQDVVHKPLQRAGIDYFAVREPHGDFAAVSDVEADTFVAPEQEEERLEENDRIATLQLVNIAFRDENKWRFFDGSSTFYAMISDDRFLHEVEAGDTRFGKGDLLKVVLREKKSMVGEQLKAEHEVVEVIEHRRSGVQLKLPITPRQ
ncbi:hypothetical protein ALP12_01042 [Pseudomonas savastanoi pv. phaseolicola]|uniref:hypothetical protein n=1 Tax=Pseudomonas syringae group genomosp. 2 TaxID=251698 RepID=UPI000EFE8DE7|nr:MULTISPECIES: hypothetical protein [Pseudomonas syringae group genomosp. 2]RMV34302.1 hypothetical protein ALP12_01042 [Pseudomonas savastanoi pv. phaseolicola]